MRHILLWMLLCGTALAQHTITISWTASTDAATTPYITYRLYRAVCPCATPPVLLVRASWITTTSYVDTAVKAGVTYIYGVTAVGNGSESVMSNLASGTVPVDAPAGVTVDANSVVATVAVKTN